MDGWLAGWLAVKNSQAKGGHRSKSWPVALLSLLCVTHTIKGGRRVDGGLSEWE